MHETVFRFGPRESLVGILTEPDRSSRKTSPLAVIINAGIVHRVGPFRLHVDIARRLAASGFASLRIDLSGLGDSPLRLTKMSTRERAMQDIQDALDTAQRRCGHDQFVLMGLCSGAFNAHKSSVRDDRVVGGVFMDGIVFRTFDFYWRHYGVRLLRGRFWRNMVRRRLLGLHKHRQATEGQRLGESAFFDNEIVPTEARLEVQQLLNRGVRMLFLYTDGYDDIAGPRQFEEMFGCPPNEQLQLEYYEKSEHTFRLRENRHAAVERIATWYQCQFTLPAKEACSPVMNLDPAEPGTASKAATNVSTTQSVACRVGRSM